MRSWPALLIAPLLVLAEQAGAFALAPWACAHQAGPWLHAVPALFVAVTVLAALVARRARHLAAPEPALVLRIGEPMAWFCVMVLLALWAPLWWLGPCRA